MVHVGKSFQRHDVSKTGSLNTTESTAFFEHYVNLYLDFQMKNGEAVAKTSLNSSLAMSKKMAKMMGGSMPKGAETEAKKQMDAQLQTMKKELEEKRKAYAQNKE